jgi:DNA repair protein RadC
LSKFRVALVREGTIPTEWDKTVRQPSDISKVLEPLFSDLDREAFVVVLLDGKNRASGINLVSLGSLTAALVHPREVFKPAIAGSAAAIILVHNHPSGDPLPSTEDIALTQRLAQVGELVGIRVLDHIVLGDGGKFHSLADEGLLGGDR